jgi:hypothetical protein
MRTASYGSIVCARLEAAGGDDLVPGPDTDGEGVRAVVQDSVGAVVGALQGLDGAAVVHPDDGACSGQQGCHPAAEGPRCVC